MERYGHLLRAAFATLHGGHADEPPETQAPRPQEPAAHFLARSRAEVLGRLQEQLAVLEPPEALRHVHAALTRLLAAAIEADQAMALQAEAYHRGEWEASLRYAEQVSQLVAESVRLDRDLILALQAAEEARPGTLAELGLAELGVGG